jgi:hypothetical protein
MSGKKRDKESSRRAALLRKLCFHWMRDNKPEEVIKMRRRIDNVVRPVKRYRGRPGNEVGI